MTLLDFILGLGTLLAAAPVALVCAVGFVVWVAGLPVRGRRAGDGF